MLKPLAVAAIAAVALCATMAVAFAAASGETEGVVVWYGTMNTHDMEKTAAEFMRLRPDIKVQTLRLGSSQLPARIITEQRAGKYNADIISGDEFQVSQLVDVGAFQKYTPPTAGNFIKGTLDPNGYWANLYMNTTVIAWNPARLAADHLSIPTSMADFADPRWRGKFGFDTGALNWYLGILQTSKDGQTLAQRITGNDPVKTQGHTQTVTLLATGEFDATPTAYGYMAEEQKRKGQDIGFENPTPLFVSLNPVGLAKNAPHPKAAKVFIDWLLSRDGQQFIAQRGGGEISSYAGVKNDPLIWDPKHPYVILNAPTPEQYNAYERQFRSFLGLPQ